MSKTPNCATCGLPMVPIVYGFPTEETFEEADKGNVVLGGCIIDFDDPQWACLLCKKENAED